MMSGRPDDDGIGGLSLHRMILISVVLHLLILSLLILSPSFPSPKLTFGPVYTVSLVSAPMASAPQKGAASLARELLGGDRRETVVKKQVAPEAAVPIRPIETHKKQETDLEKAMAEIRRKAAASEAGSRPQTKAAAEKPAAEKPAAAPAAAPSPAGRQGDAQFNAQMQTYYRTIWTRIRGGWAIPPGMLPGEVLEAVIHVKILRSGAATEIDYEKRSGNRYFDESALKAVRKAAPFPPLPAGVGEGSIEIGIRFHHPEPRF
jgi:TonB family protein